jgi:D-alanine-D-alanine ligase
MAMPDARRLRNHGTLTQGRQNKVVPARKERPTVPRYFCGMRKNIGILMGGYSSESVISEKSGRVVHSHLDRDRYAPYLVRVDRDGWQAMADDGGTWPMDLNDMSFGPAAGRIRIDGFFNAIHGTPGEDGLVQGLLDMKGIPHTSGHVLPSSLTFNKGICNGFLRQFADVNVAPSIIVTHADTDTDTILSTVGLPCFVKPNNGGSSFGVSKVKTADELRPAIAKALGQDREAIVERFVNGTEVTCGVYLSKGKVTALPATEVVSENEFFDYQAKYEGKSREITPARISIEMMDRIQETTVKVFRRLGLKGMARIDFIIQDDVPYLIEVNTVPGLSEQSIVPQQVRCAGMSLQHFFGLLIEESFATA